MPGLGIKSRKYARQVGAVELRQGEIESAIAVVSLPGQRPTCERIADQRYREAGKGEPNECVEDHIEAIAAMTPYSAKTSTNDATNLKRLETGGSSC